MEMNRPKGRKKPGDTETLRWSGRDTRWGLTLFGTAVGAGILYLPLAVASGGIWALVLMALLILPMTYLSHRALCRVVLAGKRPDGDITEAVEDHFGKTAGFIITLVYFITIYSICLVYAIGITNEFHSLIPNLLHLPQPPRWILSLVLILAMTTVVLFGTNVMTRISSILVFPLIGLLFAMSLMGIPYWNIGPFEVIPSFGDFVSAVLLGIPVLVFAMTFAPAISTFAVAYKKQIPDETQLDRKTSQVVKVNSLILFIFTFFFVFSVSLALTPEMLKGTLSRNVSAMTVIAELKGFRLIPLMAVYIAVSAIISSFFGHLVGSREGMNGIIIKWLRRNDKNRPLNIKAIDRGTIAFHVVTLWIVAVSNITIVNVISALTAPFIAIILYLMPVFAIRKVPKLAAYRTPINWFVFVMGIVTLVGYIASRFF